MTQAVPASEDTGGLTGPRSAVVVNPSKVTDLDARRREICAALADAGWPEPLWLETTPEDPGCGQTAEAVQSGAEVVFACGGDGTVMACAGTLAGTDVALAIIPSGTGNLLATNLKLPSGVVDGVRAATGGGRRRIDLGYCGKTYFTVMAGMGFDAQMIDGTSESLKRRIGWVAYVFAGVRHLRRRPMPFHLWLRQTAYQNLLRLRRQHVEADRRSVTRELPLPEGSSATLARQLLGAGPTPSEQAGEEELARRLRQAVAELPDTDREILLMRNFEGLSNQEAAQVLGLEPAAASRRYGRAILRLRKVLQAGGVMGSEP